MKYHIQHSLDTAAIAPRLADYVADDDYVVGRSGTRLDATDLEDWTIAASHSDLVRIHSAMMAEPHDLNALADAARTAAREHLGGYWIVGVHYTNIGEPHIHIAEFGSRADCYMDREDITRVRTAIARELGESIGEFDGETAQVPDFGVTHAPGGEA